MTIARLPRRRAAVAQVAILAVLLGFILRLIDIQVVSADAHIAESTRWAFGVTRQVYASRGAIVDENGQTLAASSTRYDCHLDPQQIQRTEERVLAGRSGSRPWQDVAVDVASITGQPVAEVRQIFSESIAKNPEARYAKLKSDLRTEQFQALVDLAPYVHCSEHPARIYPNGAVAGNLLGFVSTDGEALEGLEKLQDDCLAPRHGESRYRRGRNGIVLPGTQQEQPAVDGGTLRLTINRDLQWYLQQLITEETRRMKAQAGAILVYEVKTGKVRAAAEYPTVDPNLPGATEEADRGSRIFRNWFEPGSPFKALAAATVIDAGGLTSTSTVVASGFESFGDSARVRDPFQHPPYSYTLTGVLIDSSNVGIAKFSQTVPTETHYTYLKRFGIGAGTRSYPGEQEGLVHPVDEWSTQTGLNTSFGQGLTTTVPELARAYGALVNNGLKMPFTIVESCTTPEGVVVEPDLPEPEQVISEHTSAHMRAILENVFLQASFASEVAIPGYRVGGKSGTGEKADLVNGGYKSGVYFTTMVGFAPVEDPRYVVVVTLDEPTTRRSSAANAPAFRQAMMQVLKTYRIEPSTTAPELLPKFG